MRITLLENSEQKEITVEDCGERKNAFLFLQMLNHFDPFVHRHPVWENQIIWISVLNEACRTNTSAAHI